MWVFNSGSDQFPVTTGGPGSDTLAGTPYVVGSDTDPDYSPDGRMLVFRRLTATGNGGLGTWDITGAKSRVSVKERSSSMPTIQRDGNTVS